MIDDRKERLNYISAEYIAVDMLNIIRNGFFLIDPLDKEDLKKAKDYNDETDREILNRFEHIDCTPNCDCKGINLFY